MSTARMRSIISSSTMRTTAGTHDRSSTIGWASMGTAIDWGKRSIWDKHLSAHMIHVSALFSRMPKPATMRERWIGKEVALNGRHWDGRQAIFWPRLLGYPAADATKRTCSHHHCMWGLSFHDAQPVPGHTRRQCCFGSARRYAGSERRFRHAGQLGWGAKDANRCSCLLPLDEIL